MHFYKFAGFLTKCLQTSFASILGLFQISIHLNFGAHQVQDFYTAFSGNPRFTMFFLVRTSFLLNMWFCQPVRSYVFLSVHLSLQANLIVVNKFYFQISTTHQYTMFITTNAEGKIILL